MASLCGASIFSPSSSLACYQCGSRLSYYSTQRLCFLKLSDIAHNSNSLSLTVRARVTSVSETLKSELPSTSETLDSPASELPGRYSRLFPLINELVEGADVPSAMEPWLGKLSLQDWDALVRKFGGADCTTSWQIVSFFKEKASLLDESVLWPKTIVPIVERKDVEEDEERQAHPSSQAVANANVHDESSAIEAQNKPEMRRNKSPRILILYKTLAKVLGQNKKFDELQKLQEQIKNEGLEPNFSFYNAVLNVYMAEGLTENVFETVSKMENAGFRPIKFTYEKMAYFHMDKEIPDLSAATKIMRDLMGKGLVVDIGIFKNLLKAY